MNEAAPRSRTIRIRSLTKAFGSVVVLDNVSLDFEAGRVTALLGPNGAGKTTLLKGVLGLVRPDGGSVLIDQTAIDAVGRYRESVGFMPQLPRFPSHMTGHELAAMLDSLRGFQGRADDELIDAFDLRDDLDKPFRTLSGGTRQKVNAALAFRYATPIMILDEPTAGLDPVASLALKDKVRRCRDEGRTQVITSHKLGELQALADDIVFLHEGRVQFTGSLEALLEETNRSTLEEAIAELMGGGGRWGSLTPAEGRTRHGDSDDRTAPGLRVIP